jgi:hypothetical protein
VAAWWMTTRLAPAAMCTAFRSGRDRRFARSCQPEPGR